MCGTELLCQSEKKWQEANTQFRCGRASIVSTVSEDKERQETETLPVLVLLCYTLAHIHPLTGGNTIAQPVALRSISPSLGGGGNRRFFR